MDDPLKTLSELDNAETLNLVKYQTSAIDPVEYLRRKAEIREAKRHANLMLFAWMQSEKIEASRQRLAERLFEAQLKGVK